MRLQCVHTIGFVVLYLGMSGCSGNGTSIEDSDADAGSSADSGPPDCLDQWEKIRNFPEGLDVISAWGTGPNDLFVVAGDYWSGSDHGSSPQVLHYDGSDWTPMDLGDLEGRIEFAAIWGASGSDVFMVGGFFEDKAGFIAHYDGKRWTVMDVGIDFSLACCDAALPNPIWGSAGDDVFVVGQGGTILHYDGITWSDMNSGLDNDLIAVWGISPDDVYAGGYLWGDKADLLFHYDGESWQPVPIDLPSDFAELLSLVGISDIWASSGNDIYVVSQTALGFWGTIAICLHYDEDRWVECSGLAIENTDIESLVATDVWGTRSDNVYVLSWYQGPNHFDGSKWTSSCEGDLEVPFLIFGTSDRDIFFFNGRSSGDEIYRFKGYSEQTLPR